MVTQVIEQPKFSRTDHGRFANDWDDDDDRPHPIITDDDSFDRDAALEGLKLRVAPRGPKLRVAGTIVVGGLCVR